MRGLRKKEIKRVNHIGDIAKIPFCSGVEPFFQSRREREKQNILSMFGYVAVWS